LFYNLIDNAIKFQPGDRVPVVSVKASPWEEPDDSGFQYRSWLKLSFVDNGMGVAPGEEDRIFRLFEGPAVPGKHAHYGKGLAVCKKIAELHGGHIRVVSNAGAGSSFVVFLPVISEEHIAGAGTAAALMTGLLNDTSVANNTMPRP
jgi:signal transduction histidine kinase